MAYLIADASTTRFSSTATLGFSSEFTSFVNGNDTQGLTASATGTAATLSISINNWLSATNIKACLYDEDVLVETVVIPSSVGTGVVDVALAGTTTITSGNLYRLALYSQSGQDFTLDTDTGGLTLRTENSGSGSYTTPIDPYPTGSFQSFNEYYWAVQDSGGGGRSITDIDTDNDVQAGQTNITITTVGLDASPATQTATLGGESLTVNSWSATAVNVDIPLHIDLEWGSITNQLALTDDTGTVTLDNVTLSAPTGWETVTYNGSAPNPVTTESFYEYAQTDAGVGSFTMATNDILAWETQSGLSIDVQTIPIVAPPATVSGAYKIWDTSLSTWTTVSDFTITDGGVLTSGGESFSSLDNLLNDFKTATSDTTFGFNQAASRYYQQVGSVTTKQFNEALKAAQNAVPFSGLGPSDRRN